MIEVRQLPHPIHDGDWHDAPLRWTVQGPGTERQNFSTKRDAALYARLRRKWSAAEATRRFIEAALTRP